MAKKIWQTMTKLGVLAASMGLMSASALANGGSYNHDCSGGGTTNPNCFNWTFNNTLTNTQGKTISPPDPGVTATASGWANTVGIANVNLETAYVTLNGSLGLGVRNNDCTGYSNCTPGLSGSGLDASEGVSPEHAMDNNDRVDSIMFTFSEKVNLSSFSAGWVQTDSDYSVLAYTGSGAPTLAGLSYSQLLSNGWSLIGNYYVGDLGQPSSGTGAHDFANSTYSSYWLIGALNTFVGGDAAKAGNDYFKLISLAGCTCDNAPPGTPGCGGGGGGGVPEPGTLLLMSAGFIGLARINRRRQVVAA
jgi:hypothetical protein